MKTFKLKLLNIMEEKTGEIIPNQIPLLDGLIIDREDENNQWTIEVYTDNSFQPYFEFLQKTKSEILVQVKISKESNDLATFITSIIGINEIGSNINVLFVGNIVDKRKENIEFLLTTLIEEGYQGKELLEKFKELT
ncbi:YwpF family protein [Virgibacillus sp. Bac330]|uniref:YwpF family protein n=1 Tax=Virgibacillus sp. Bac330 TaxID=2419841 RepID=UPI000EF5327B|nr:YwpF family protein [Virgibacillus sp. Bac330]